MVSEILKNAPKDYKDDEEILSLLISGNFAEAFSGMNLASAVSNLYARKMNFQTGETEINSTGEVPDADFLTFMTTNDNPTDSYRHHEALLKILKKGNLPKEDVGNYINNTMIPTYINWPYFSNEQRNAHIKGLQEAFATIFPTIH